MLRGIQPLKLLENATATALGSRRPVTFDGDDDDDDDDDDDVDDDEYGVGKFSSALQEIEPQQDDSSTSTDSSIPPASIVASPSNESPEALMNTTPSKSRPTQNESQTISSKSPTSAVAHPCANTISPCDKGKEFTGVPPTKKKRLSLVEQTCSSSLSAAKKLVEYTETLCKTLHDDWKRSQKTVKQLQQQLQDAQRLQEFFQTQLDTATQDKKLASRDYKKLVKQWDKYKTIEEKKELERKEALQETKKRQLVQNVDTPNKSRRKKGKNEGEEESTNMELNDVNTSEEEDSDWEGAKRSHRNATKSPPSSTSKRIGGRRKVALEEWQCSACTLLNSPDAEECEVCGMPK